MLDASFYRQVTDSSISKEIESVSENEHGFYRIEQQGTYTENAANLNRIWSMEQYSSSIYSSTYNADYQEFRQTIFDVEQPYRNLLMQVQAKNPIFQNFMGVKYLISETSIPGYQKLTDHIYENTNALPIAYTTDQTLSKEEYKKLSFPYDQTAFLSTAVTENDGTMTAQDLMNIQKEHLQEFSVALPSDIQTQQTIRQTFPIPTAEEGDLLFLQFHLKNKKPSQDISISVEGIRNKLTAQNHIYYNENVTFTYVVSLQNGQDQIDIHFGPGSYEISGMQSYLLKSGNETIKTDDFSIV